MQGWRELLFSKVSMQWIEERMRDMYFVYQQYYQLPSSRIFHGENILLNL